MAVVVPGAPASAAAAAPAVAPSALGGGTAATVTLITGDTVRYAADRTGRVSATVTPGTGRDAVTFRGYTEGEGYFLLPSDAEQSVRAGLLDKRLFDVAYLAKNGYGNDKTAELPVIVQYKQGLTRSTKALPSARTQAALPSVDGAAVRVSKPSANKFWDAVRTGTDLRKVWLDGKVTASDDVSAAQIGAPAAWAAGLDGSGVSVGIIDTGIDATHQDLRDRVAAARNFVEAGQPGGNAPEDVTDRHGHGTHVASIIAGSGAASNGRHKGVAPGAKLTIAKALDDTGNGTDSAVIAAMQWQASQVRVVSMSLGGDPSDGTDPVSQAVNDLTAQYGTLFVIAAGNDGPNTRTVAQPGAATAALTIGAVDSADKLANFSSRGPRLGDFAIKPEISAPGVGTIAARAAGTSMGTPVDANYTAASGTSMATPHVAAAAAILAQQNPEWRADQLKNALIGSAKNTGGSPYLEGAGRVDIARAIRQRVFVDTPSVSKAFTHPPTGETLTKTITYRNTGSADVDLSLSATMTAPDGRPAPAGVVALDQSGVRVPAGGTASVRLTLDPRPAAGQGLHSGRLVAASAAGDQLIVPIGFQLQVKQATLTIRVIGGANRYIFPAAFSDVSTLRVNDTVPELAMEPMTTNTYNWRLVDAQLNAYESKVQLAEGGAYLVEGQFAWRDLATGRNHATFINRPEVLLTGDKTITLDMDDATAIGFQTPKPSTAVNINLDWQRVTASGQHYYGFFLGSFWTVAVGQVWVFPSEEVTVGRFAVGANQILSAPQATVTVNGRSAVTLRPVYTAESSGYIPKFATDQRLKLATEADLRAGKDVTGALVFVRGTADIRSTVDLAVKAKAAGVLSDTHVASLSFLASQVGVPIPLLYLDFKDSARVAAALTGVKRPTADIEAQLVSPYEYKLVNYQYNHIPASMTMRPRERELTRLEATYHAQTPAPNGTWGPHNDGNEVSFTYLPDQAGSIHLGHPFHAHGRRTEYYNTTGTDVLWWRQYQFTAAESIRIEHTYRGFTKPTSGREEWNEPNLPVHGQVGPQTPADAAVFWPCDGCRQGDILRVRSLGWLGVGQYAGRSDPSHSVQEDGPTEEVHLYSGGTELPPAQDAAGLNYYQLPAGAATYRLTSDYTTGSPQQSFARTVNTTWTFRSAAPATDTVAQPYWCIDELLYGDTKPCSWQPLIHLGYQLGLAPDDSARAARPHTFTVTAQGGAPGSAAKLAGLRVWTSVDGGEHWVPARAVRAHSGAYQVTVWNPRLADAPSGRVSLKVEAWDRSGNSIQQILDQAYALR